MSGADLAELEARLGHRFADRRLLDRALTHTSAAEAVDANYQRLEFLGDRVLALCVAERLLSDHPGEAEGEVARRLNQLVKRDTCAAVAVDVGLGPHLRLGDGEAKTGGRKKPAILADACESVIAALYLDGGLELARGFVDRHFMTKATEAVVAPRDAKTTLQEWLQGRGRPAPRYRPVERSGPDHAPTFTVACEFGGLEVARGTGGSKREAEQDAARRALVVEGVWTEDTHG